MSAGRAVMSSAGREAVASRLSHAPTFTATSSVCVCLVGEHGQEPFPRGPLYGRLLGLVRGSLSRRVDDHGSVVHRFCMVFTFFCLRLGALKEFLMAW